MEIGQAVEGFLHGYFSTCRRSAKTQAAYRVDLAQLRLHCGSDKPLHSIDAECLEAWADQMRSGGLAPVSIRRKFATARVFFAYWVRRRFLDASPLWRIRLDLGRQRLLPRSLTASDAKLLIEQAWRNVSLTSSVLDSARDPRFLAVRNLTALEILFATGMRVGELVNLGVRDWCGEDSTFVVMGKGMRQRLAVMPDERSQRAVKIYLCHRMAMSLNHDGFLVNAWGRRLSSQGVARILADLAQKGGIARRVTPHMIRHTVATLLLRCGADIRVVQELLGHASIATTQRYTYVSKEHLFSTLQARHPNKHLDIKMSLQSMEGQLPLPFDQVK